MGLSGFVPLSLSVGRPCVRPTPKRTRRQRGADHRRRSVNPPNRIRDVASARVFAARHQRSPPLGSGTVCAKSLRGRCPPPIPFSYCPVNADGTRMDLHDRCHRSRSGINIVRTRRQPSVHRGTCGLRRDTQVCLYRICYRPKGRGVAWCDKGFVTIAIDAITAVYNPCTKSTKLSSTSVDQVRRDYTTVITA